jgi:hypothetical protein
MVMRAATVIALCGLAQASPREKALAEFKRAFRPAKNPANAQQTREKALKGLGKDDNPEVAKALLLAVVQLEAEVSLIEEARREYLGTPRYDRALQSRAVLDPLRKLQDEVRVAVLKVEEPSAIRFAATEALRNGKLPFSLRIALASRVGDDDVPELEMALRRSRDSASVTVALMAAGAQGRSSPERTARVAACLHAKEPVVREAAAATLARMCVPHTIEPLIDRLAKEQGKTKERLAAALEVLTRQRFGTAEAAWRRWWTDHGRACLEGKVELGGGEVSGPGDTEVGRYHTIPMTGDSILYLLDRSNTMNRSLKNPPNVAGPDEESRITRAKDELVNALAKLPPRKKFNIITFAKDAQAYSEAMQPATPENIKRARVWVERLTLEFGTSLYDGLDLAFALAGRPPRDGFYGATIDTMFVLTDGRPMVPRPAGRGLAQDNRDAILAAVDRWNLLNRVVIHTIGMGEDLPKGFLKKLAKQNGGRFVHER